MNLGYCTGVSFYNRTFETTSVRGKMHGMGRAGSACFIM